MAAMDISGAVRSENLRGMLAMTAGMACIASVDAVIKAVSHAFSPAHIVTIVGFGGMIVFAIAATRRGTPLLSPAIFSRTVIARNLFEVGGSFGTVLALSLVPLSVVTTIGQAIPLMVTLGAFLFMDEHLDWRAWGPLALGFVGMLLIIRPGLDAFDPFALVAVAATICLAARDLASRGAPKEISTLQLGVWGLAALGLTGLCLSAVSVRPLPPITPVLAVALVAIVAFSGAAFYCITSAMRTGNVATVSPFRYTRLLFGIAFGVLFFGESVDAPMIAGGVVIVASGLAVWRLEISTTR